MKIAVVCASGIVGSRAGQGAYILVGEELTLNEKGSHIQQRISAVKT